MSLDEFELIAQVFAPLAARAPEALGLADDAALLAPPRGEELVVTTDCIVAGVHFLADDPPETVAKKLLRVNLSDLAAMAATPWRYLMSCALGPACDEDWARRFAQGLAEDQTVFDVHLIGGDTVLTPGPFTASLTAIGRVARGRALRRSGARPGDRVFVSGSFGDAAMGLLLSTGRVACVDPLTREALVGRYRVPEPRLALGRALAGLASAAIDVSDGLVADLGHIADVSGVAIVIEEARVPVRPSVAALCAEYPEHALAPLVGGDDYELAFTVPPDHVAAVAALGRRLDVALSEIGRVEEGPAGVTVLDPDGRVRGLAETGYRHRR